MHPTFTRYAPSVDDARRSAKKMKSALLLFVLWPLVPVLVSAEPTGNQVFNSTLPSESKITISSNAAEFIIDIETPDSLHRFWQSHPTVRISYSTHLPTISLIANIGKPDEVRLVLQPENVNRHFDAPPETLTLQADGKDVGKVTLQTSEGKTDPHRARYIVRQDFLHGLGQSFILVSGNPLTHHIEIKKPNKAADSAATRVTPPSSSLRSGQEPRHGQP